MFQICETPETALIEKKIFNRVLQQLDLSYQELHEKYQDEFPEPVNGINYSPFIGWFNRGGMKLRRIMSLLALVKHTVVIVPADATVSVTLKGRKSVDRIAPVDTITVFVSNQQETDIRVETLIPQAIEENTEAPFRKRRPSRGKVIEKTAAEQALAALMVSDKEADVEIATQEFAQIESTAENARAVAEAAAQEVAEKKAIIEKAIEEREEAKKLSAQIRNEQLAAAKDAKEKEALKRKIKESVKAAAPQIAKKRIAIRKAANELAAMRAATAPSTPAQKLMESEAFLQELEASIKTLAQKDLVKKISEKIEEAKAISVQKMADQRAAALKADEKIAMVKDLKIAFRTVVQVAADKESAAKAAADRLAALNEAIEQAKKSNP